MSRLVGSFRLVSNFYVSALAASQLNCDMARNQIRQTVTGFGNVTVPSNGIVVERHDNYIGDIIAVSMSFTTTGNGQSPSAIDSAIAEGLRRSGWGHVPLAKLRSAPTSGVSAHWQMGVPFVGDFREATREITRGIPNEGAVAPPIAVGGNVASSSDSNRVGQQSEVNLSNIAGAVTRNVTQPSALTRVAIYGAVAIGAAVAIGYTVRSFK